MKTKILAALATYPAGRSAWSRAVKTYRFRFVGRPVGAIGILWEQEATACGETLEAARLALYDRFEHLSILSAEEVAL